MTTMDAKVDPKTSHTSHHGPRSHTHGAMPRPAQRRRRKPLIRGQDGTQWKDLYHQVLTVPWWMFFAGLVGFFIALNLLFATLYLADPQGLLNARPGSLWDRFFFSVSTISTMSSPMVPRSDYIRVVMAFEAFCGIVNLALITGVIFARFSRPFARVVFSNVAVIVPFEGVPTLMLRAANQRGNQILDAAATVSIARQVTTAEGITMRRFEELRLARSRSPLFSLSWTMMHPIDKASPLYGLTPDNLNEQDVDILVLLSGTDETLSQLIYARHTYSAEDIHFDRRFVDVLKLARGEGRTEVNLHRFHDTEPWPQAGRKHT